MRILVVCDHLALTGGLLRFARAGRVLARRGHHVAFATLGSGAQGFATDLPVLTLAAAEACAWDVVMVPGGGFPDAAVAGFARLRDPRFGLRVHHFLNGPARAPAYARVAAAFAPEVVVVNNDHWDEAGLAALGPPAHRLVGAVDAALFAPPVRPVPRSGRRRLGAIANKRPEALLAALDALGEGWALHWFGRPDPALLAARADLVASGRLVVDGVLTEADLPGWYHGLDAFCSAEAYAGWCNPAAEAMACGVPLVTTVHGTLAFAEAGVTALVLPDAPDAELAAGIARAVADIAADPEAAARRAEAGRARIRPLDWEAYADGLLAILRESASLAQVPGPSDELPPVAIARQMAVLARVRPLPEDFDAAGYLRLYDDLAALFVHPWQAVLHYLEHGRHEGRTYPSTRTRAQEKAAQAVRIAVTFDGLDGSGKSTIARLTARALGASLLAPFSGPVGTVLVHLARTGRHDLADELAHAAVGAALAGAAPGPVVFDRHWFTASGLLSARYRAGWEPRPFTVMCWADRPTTLARLVASGVTDPGRDITQARLDSYRGYAADLGLPLLDTSRTTPEEAVSQVLAMLAERGQGIGSGAGPAAG